jgi:hypothetical protein
MLPSPSGLRGGACCVASLNPEVQGSVCLKIQRGYTSISRHQHAKEAEKALCFCKISILIAQNQHMVFSERAGTVEIFARDGSFYGDCSRKAKGKRRVPVDYLALSMCEC